MIDVCLQPERWVGVVLYLDEVEILRALGGYFQDMIEDLGDVSEAEYLSDPRWPEVVRLSDVALKTMQPRDLNQRRTS